MYNVPILLVIFKRKDAALKTLQAIKTVKPAKLYIAADGARETVEGELEKVEDTRQAILDAIDWECEVKTRFSEKNQGCANGVYNAINWLFDHEDRGIVIEDDCVMQNCFFKFTEELLERYKDDNRIGMICGANYAEQTSIPDSYVFSRYKSCHGWATWKRAWKLMDMEMSWRKSPYSKSVIGNMGYHSKDKHYWNYRLKAIDLNDVSAWDWQWYFTLAANNMLAIIPKYMLTTNIGFGKDATHTTSHATKQYISSKSLEFPLQHPRYVIPYEPFEKAFYKGNNTLLNSIKQLIPFKIKHIIKNIIRS